MNRATEPVTPSDDEADPMPYWLKGDPIQNYGDFLSEMLFENLFEAPPPGVLRVIGSCLADDFVPESLPKDRVAIFWGCGARDEAGMSDAARARVEILSVRGPLTRSVLRLGNGVPIGDTALLLPLLHTPPEGRPVHPQALLVPHFHDRHTDEALCAASGCDAVLRPNLRNRRLAVVEFIDAITRARFVLAGSLHAAITAAAYGVPFAFWDSGAIDLPFKWRDFAASARIPCTFHAQLDDSEAWFAREVAPVLSLPPLWPMLAVAPLPVRPDLLIEAMRRDVERHGPDVLDMATAPRSQMRLVHYVSRLLRDEHPFHREVSKAVDAASLDQADVSETARTDASSTKVLQRLRSAETGHQALGESLPAMQGMLSGLRKQLDREHQATPAQGEPLEELSDFELRKLEHFVSRQEQHIRALDQTVRSQALTIKQLRSQAASPVPYLVSVDVPALQQRLQAVEAERDEMLRSAVWRVGRRLRRLGFRYPRVVLRVRQLLKLTWWTVTLRLSSRLRQRHQLRRDLELLQDSPLFDAAWYRMRYMEYVSPHTDPLMHYIWIGAQRDLNPNPLFDAGWYRSQMPPGAVVNPLVHYLSDPFRHDPHPLFDTQHYLRRFGGRLPAGQTPLEHFLTYGEAASSPNAIFDAAAYVYEYPQAAAYPGGAFAHYVEHGEAAGLAPHPLFDPAWYAASHPGREGLDPLAHYLRRGREAGLAGSALIEAFDGRVGTLPLRLVFPETEAPEISVIVPTYGHLHETIRCLAAVMANTSDLSYEVLVVDDRPHAPIAPLLEGQNLRVQSNAENLGFLRSCNAAAKRARGDKLVFLNNDTTVGANWLRPMVALVDADRRVGMVGCKLLNTDGTVQEAGGIIHSNGWGFPYGNGSDPTLGAYNYVREVDVVTGACFLVRRDLFEQLGGFDDRYAPAFYEEFDLATSLRDFGYKVLYQPASIVTHHGSASYGSEARDRQSKRNHAKFCAKWRTLLARQPVEGDPLFLARERPSSRGIILVIDDKVPEYDKHAGAVTLFQYLELMCELGLKVVFHPQDAQPLQPYTNVLQQRGIEVLHAPETLAGWLRRNGRHLDYVWTARPYVTFPILDLIKRNTGAPILYYTHDLHYLREMRRYELDGTVWALEESQRLKPMELGIFASVDRVMTPSAEEARIIAAEVPEAHVTVVPPYLFDDVAVNAARLDFTGKSELVFVGGFDHTPNVDAALWLVFEIMPLVWARKPEVRAMIVGNAPPPEVRALAGPRVDVTGFVPTLDPYYERARISVSPLRYGAGVKGKIVSALQAGVPVVTTGCGNEGIQLRHGVEALIGETPADIASAIITLLDDDALCRSLALAAADVVRTRFSARRARSILLGLLGDDLCPVCGTRPRNPRIARQSDWRESFSCMTCLALNRSAALAQIIVAPYHKQRVASLREALPLLNGLRIHEFSFVGPVMQELSTLSGFTFSEFFEDVAPGALGPDGTMCQDVQNLTFENASIDLLISQDVMEHIPAPDQAFRELFRVLRPGGRHVFTIPYSPGASHTIQRAVVEHGVLRHLLPPEYHGDPIRSGGALVFSDYGADLLDWLCAIGFAVTLHSVGRGESAARHVLVFEATKPN